MTDPADGHDPEAGTSTGIGARQASLPPALRELHRGLLHFFLDHGSPPATTWLTGQAAAHGLPAEEAVAALADGDLVHVEGGIVTVAYPFSGTPTRNCVEPDHGPAVYAMCAIDALGLL